MWDRLRTELPPCHVPDEVYAIAEVYVYRMAATAPPYSRPDIVRGEQCAGAPLIEAVKRTSNCPCEAARAAVVLSAPIGAGCYPASVPVQPSASRGRFSATASTRPIRSSRAAVTRASIVGVVSR
jgi:hypothetical protein